MENLYSIEQVKDLIMRKFEKVDVPVDQASIVADHLIYADMRGVHSHGMIRVKAYVKRILEGGINLNPNIKVEQNAPTMALIDGDNGLGMPVTKLGVEKAIEIAKKYGMASVGVKNINHSGTMSYYLEEVAKANLVGITMATAEPIIAPYGATQSYFGTNPLAFVAPVKDNYPIMLDMATSQKAFGYVMNAKNKGEEIPLEWGAVDKNGEPTTNPNEAVRMLPIAQAKGYGIMMMINILSGIMLNELSGDKIPSYTEKKRQGLAQFFIVIDPANFMPLDDFLEDMKTMYDEITNMLPAKDFDRVRVPGQRGYELFEKNLENGLELNEKVREYLEDDGKL